MKSPLIFADHEGPVKTVSWFPDGDVRLIASSGMDTTVRLWDLSASPASMRVLRGHRDLVRAVSWSPDGELLASGSDDLTIRLWDPESGELELSLGGPPMSDVERLAQKTRLAGESPILFHGAAPGQKGHQDYITALTWSPDGGTLASSSYDKTVRLWSPTQGADERKILHYAEFVFALAWPANPGALTVGEETGYISVYIHGEETVPLGFNTGYKEVSSIAWAPDGATMAVASYVRPTIALWSARGKRRTTLNAHPEKVRSLAWSPDGGHLASAGPDGVRVWSESG